MDPHGLVRRAQFLHLAWPALAITTPQLVEILTLGTGFAYGSVRNRPLHVA